MVGGVVGVGIVQLVSILRIFCILHIILPSFSFDAVAYIRDRYSCATRTTTTVSVQSLADSFAASFGGRRRLLESDAFANFMLNLTESMMAEATGIGASEDVFKNSNNLVSVANSPSGAAGMTTEKQQEFVSGLVASMTSASTTMETSEESIELMMGSMGSVANGNSERLDGTAQSSLFENSLALLDTASTPGARLAISESSSSSACMTFATLLGSDSLFGPSNSNSTNNSKALSAGLNNLASGKLVGRYAGMGASETSCSGLLVSAQKLSAEDTDGAPIAAGNSSFTMPANFSKMTNISAGDTVETSAQVIPRKNTSLCMNTISLHAGVLFRSCNRTHTEVLPKCP
jgi:hypothetical protein